MPLTIELQDAPEKNEHAVLAQMAFGASAPDAISHHGLQPLGREAAFETWRTTAPETGGRYGAVTWRANDHLLFGSAAVPLDGDTARVTYDLYRDVFGCTEHCGFAHLLRIWHYLPRINDGTGDDEHYKHFSLGRARAFDERPGSSAHLPAGTGIGTRAGNDLLIYFIATHSPGRQIENPRQVSAFDYPRTYGPREPLFSRAVVWSQGDDARLLISGTASIVGHESQHADDLRGQLAELWRNLECLRERAGATRPLALRIYVRHTSDYPAIRDFLEARVDADVATLYLHAEICRSELLVEIEGVWDMPDGAD